MSRTVTTRTPLAARTLNWMTSHMNPFRRNNRLAARTFYSAALPDVRRRTPASASERCLQFTKKQLQNILDVNSEARPRDGRLLKMCFFTVAILAQGTYRAMRSAQSFFRSCGFESDKPKREDQQKKKDLQFLFAVRLMCV